MPETTFRPELIGATSLIRELHVYGSVVPVSERKLDKFQHQGYGVLLMENAEKIAKNEHGSKKIAVISGVGTRKYYRKLGYHLEGPYMVKSLERNIYKSALRCVNANKRRRSDSQEDAPREVPRRNHVRFETFEEYRARHYARVGIRP